MSLNSSENNAQKEMKISSLHPPVNENENQKQKDLVSEESNRIQEIKNQEPLVPQFLICSLCLDLVIHSATTICQHVFCEMCLLEHFVFMADCPVCGKVIRKQAYSKNLHIDNLVAELVKQLQQGKQGSSKGYFLRKSDHQKYLEQKKISAVSVGLRVDAQDIQGVWRKGTVAKINRKVDESDSPQISIKFDGISKRSTFRSKSHMLARLDFYSERNNIPRIVKGKVCLKDPENQEQYFVYPSNGKTFN